MTPDLPPHIPPAVQRIERLISTVLRAGVTLSLVVIVLGTVVSFLHHPGYLWNTKDLPTLTFPGSAQPNSIADIDSGIRAGRGTAIIMAGLLLLIATPVLRVAISILAFLLQRDWVFTIITAVVFALLLLSFFLGRTGN